jgi:AcrR family transcriptional regulator
MTTKEKILDASLRLFNLHGVETITVRHIAAELGISHGNLCYHYRRKEDIIEALYYALVEEMNVHMQDSMITTFDLNYVYTVVVRSFGTLYRYKFLFLEFVSISRSIPEIKVHFNNLELQRRNEFRQACFHLSQSGFLVSPLNEKLIDIFIEQLFLISNFWISESEILYNGREEDKIEHYARLAFILIVPFLNDKGKLEYDKFMNEKLGSGD